MDFAGIKVPDTALVRDAIDLSRSLLKPFLFNHVVRSWLFGILLSEAAEVAPDAELLGSSCDPARSWFDRAPHRGESLRGRRC
jgi:hypothetical protein